MKGPVLNGISDFMAKAEPALSNVSELEIASLNQTLESMEKPNEEELNQAVINLNKIVDDLNSLSEKIRSIFSF